MKVSKSSIMGFVYGAALAVCGIPFYDWRFWVLMPLAVFWGVAMSKEQQP